MRILSQNNKGNMATPRKVHKKVIFVSAVEIDQLSCFSLLEIISKKLQIAQTQH